MRSEFFEEGWEAKGEGFLEGDLCTRIDRIEATS